MRIIDNIRRPEIAVPAVRVFILVPCLDLIPDFLAEASLKLGVQTGPVVQILCAASGEEGAKNIICAVKILKN